MPVPVDIAPPGTDAIDKLSSIIKDKFRALRRRDEEWLLIHSGLSERMPDCLAITFDQMSVFG
jgi:hypothetical protein